METVQSIGFLALRAMALGRENKVSGVHPGVLKDFNRVGGPNSYAIGDDDIIGSTPSSVFVMESSVKPSAPGVTRDAFTNKFTYQGESDVSGALALGNAASVTEKDGVALGALSVAGHGGGRDRPDQAAWQSE